MAADHVVLELEVDEDFDIDEELCSSKQFASLYYESSEITLEDIDWDDEDFSIDEGIAQVKTPTISEVQNEQNIDGNMGDIESQQQSKSKDDKKKIFVCGYCQKKYQRFGFYDKHIKAHGELINLYLLFWDSVVMG